MEITKEQDEAIRTMRAEAAHVNDLRKKLESSETKLTSKAKEFFKEVFGTGIEARPIFVLIEAPWAFRLSLLKLIREMVKAIIYTFMAIFASTLE